MPREVIQLLTPVETPVDTPSATQTPAPTATPAARARNRPEFFGQYHLGATAGLELDAFAKIGQSGLIGLVDSGVIGVRTQRMMYGVEYAFVRFNGSTTGARYHRSVHAVGATVGWRATPWLTTRISSDYLVWTYDVDPAVLPNEVRETSDGVNAAISVCVEKVFFGHWSVGAELSGGYFYNYDLKDGDGGLTGALYSGVTF